MSVNDQWAANLADGKAGGGYPYPQYVGLEGLGICFEA
jgi:hypothetical protein